MKHKNSRKRISISQEIGIYKNKEEKYKRSKSKKEPLCLIPIWLYTLST